MEFCSDLFPAFAGRYVGSRPADGSFQIFLDPFFDLASPCIGDVVPAQIMVIPEENLKDMAERQIDQPCRREGDMKSRPKGRVEFVLEIGKGDLSPDIL